MAPWLSAILPEEFRTPHPHGGSQSLITPVPGDPTPSSVLFGHCTHVVHTYICAEDTHKINL